MKKPDPTGYNPKTEVDDETKNWTAERAGRFYSTKPAVRVLCNDEPRGLIFCTDEEEMEWIINRMTGEQE